MRRRSFIKGTTAFSLLYDVGAWFTSKKTHILTFSFDDGFKKSFYRAAEIHEEYGLSACFNVIASGHLPEFKAVDDWIRPELLGDFDDWNTLKGRGHEVMPHTWEHLNLTKVPLRKAKNNIDKCLEYFERHLDGYKNEEAVFNYAFCASTPEIEAYTLEKVLAARTGGWLFLEDKMTNDLPTLKKPIRLGCWTQGPGFSDDYLENEIDTFLEGPGGWLIFNLHGFDNEGWGPVSTKYFDGLLKRLVMIDYLNIKPTGMVLKEIS
ncbi:MAG: polysaccharide deacetylase family protein [Saprospiraceae bacterium]|nr:polysaccharide deacetylase family protein [Saprospiraceae bacterium]